MRHSLLLALTCLVAGLMLPMTGACDEDAHPVPPPMVFAVPRVEITGDSPSLLDGAELGFALPMSRRTSVTGSFVWDTNSDNYLNATYNLDFAVDADTTARVYGGILQDDFGVGVTAHRTFDRYGAGAFIQSVDGDTQLGVFLSTPLRLGLVLGGPVKSRDPADAGRALGPADLGALATIRLRSGDKTELATGTAWFPRRDPLTPRIPREMQALAPGLSDLSPPATESWSFQARAAITGGPVVSRDRVLAGAGDGSVYALRLSDGRPLWTAAAGSPVTGIAVTAGDRVYVGTRAGHLVCLRPPMLAEGIVAVEEWRFGAQGALNAPPAITPRGLIVMGSEDGTCYALDADGTVAWTAQTRGSIVAGVAVSDSQHAVVGADGRPGRPVTLIFCAGTDGLLYALRETDGEVLWTFDAGAPLRTTPAVQGRTIIISTEDGTVYALDAASGRDLWSRRLDGPALTTPAIADDRAFLAGADGSLTALSLRDGSRQWFAELFGRVSSPPIATRNRWLFVVSEAGMAYAVRRTDGRIMWARNARDTITSQAVLAPRHLLFGTDTGRIQAFEPGGEMRVDPPPVVVGGGDDRPTIHPVTVDVLAERERNGETAAAPRTPDPAQPAADQPGDEPALSVSTVAVRQDFPSPTTGRSGPQVSALSGNVSMTLLTRTGDPRQAPIMVADRASVIISGTAPAGTVEVHVNDTPVSLVDGRFRSALAFSAAGAYPLTIKYVGEQGTLHVDRRIVMISPEERPASSAPVFFSPADETPGNRVSFTMAWDSPQATQQVTVLEIHDEAGRAIRAWADASGGASTFEWDGRDQWGNIVPDGQYVAVYTVRDMQGRTRSMYQPVIVDAAGM